MRRKNFIQKLHSLMRADNLTVSDVATRSGLSKPTVYALLRPSGDVPNKPTLIALAVGLGLQPVYFLKYFDKTLDKGH